jgi:hypothetical protein
MMFDCKYTRFFAACAILAAMTMTKPASAQSQKLPNGFSSGENGAQYAGSSQILTLDCAGRDAQIAGSYNTLTLTGGCTKLEMFGSNNTVTIAFGNNASITWTSADGKKPAVTHVGANNTLIPGR